MGKAIIDKKAELVRLLADKFKEVKTAIIFDYQGLTVGQFTNLRNELRKAECEVKVYKNNITQRAVQLVGYEKLTESFVGAKALIMSFNDVVAPAKIIVDFAKENKVVNIEAGIIEGKTVGKAELINLANLPSRETLLTQLAAGLLMPVKEIAIGLNMICEERK